MRIDPTARYIVLDQTKTRIGLSRREITLLLLAVLPALMDVTAHLENAWTIRGGVGLSQHAGFFVIFAITPLVLFLSAYVLRSFVTAVEDIDNYCTPYDEKTRNWIARLVNTHIDRMTLHGDTTPILLIVMTAFAGFCVYNVTTTIDPVPTYGHDVFDSWAHPGTFFIAKAYVFVALAGIWSVAIFICLHVTYSMFSILRFLQRHDALQINLFHRDNCGGTSCFGDINVAITAIYTCFLLVVVAMFSTHRTTYPVIDCGFAAISIVTIAQTFGAVFSIHSVIRQKKRACLDDLAATINERIRASTTSFPNDLLSYRNHVMGLHTFPYAKGTLVLVNTLRFAPIIVALGTLASRLN